MPFFNINSFKERRKKVLSLMTDKSLMYLDSASMKERNTDNNYLYRQDSNFFYLTGINDEDCALILVKNGKTVKEMLFIVENNPLIELWIGRKKSKDEMKKETGIEEIFYQTDFFNQLAININDGATLYFDFVNKNFSPLLDYQHYKLSKLREHYPQISKALPANNLIYPIRMVKDDSEIKAIRKAVEITRDGLLNAMKNVRPGMYEYEVQAEMEYIFMKNGVKMSAFPSIVGAGINGATLHYNKNNCRIKKDELVLMDVGAEYENYAADITRVFPSSGRFTDKQKRIYNALFDVQNEIINLVKPGISLKLINDKSNLIIGKMLKSLKYIKDEMEFKKYYAHSIGHMLGLDTHDVNTFPRTFPLLKENMVLTIEPGVYIPEESLGIRIEDDILVTKNGNTVLSHDIPKSVSEIEKAVRG